MYKFVSGLVCGCLSSALTYYLFNKYFKVSPVSDVMFSNVNSICCYTLNQNAPNSTGTVVSKPCTKYCMNQNLKKLIKYIDSAKFTINIGMYIFTSKELSDTILRAFNRGIQVRVITCKTMVFSTGSQIRKFEDIGIPVRYDVNCDSLVHHKFCLIDADRSRGILITGSMNWTLQAFSGNYDNLLVTSDKVLVKRFQEEFDIMWNSFINVCL